MEEPRSNYCTKCFAFFILGLFNLFNDTKATIRIVHVGSNQTVFSAEEHPLVDLNAYGLEGVLVTSDPENACSPVKHPPFLSPKEMFGAGNRSDDFEKTNFNATQYDENGNGLVENELHQLLWILIAKAAPDGHENCSLAQKAKSAQAVGYSGIIVIKENTTMNSTLPNGRPYWINFDWFGVNIYASIISEDIGQVLWNRYSYPNEYIVKFENETYYSIIILVMSVLLLIILLITCKRTCYCRCFMIRGIFRRRAAEARRLRKSVLSQSQLSKIPVLGWTPSFPQESCSICLENYKLCDEIRVLPCSHVFHMVCIDPWLLKESRRCPNCKRRLVFPNEEFSETSSSSDSEDERTPLVRTLQRYNGDSLSTSIGTPERPETSAQNDEMLPSTRTNTMSTSSTSITTESTIKQDEPTEATESIAESFYSCLSSETFDPSSVTHDLKTCNDKTHTNCSDCGSRPSTSSSDFHEPYVAFS